MSHPLVLGNYLLIGVGVLLLLSGPIIVYRTAKGMMALRSEDPKADLHPWSNGLNFLIGVVFFGAGILFILNNLRGNPLA